MKKFDSRYIIGVFLVLFILIGSVEFILKGHHSFTLNEIYFRVPIVVVGMVEMLPNAKAWGTFRVLFLVFLSDYLLKKIFDHFGLEEITLTFIPYLIILGILLVIFFARLTIKKDFFEHIKKENK